jgi:hypothetical protein
VQYRNTERIATSRQAFNPRGSVVHIADVLDAVLLEGGNDPVEV